MSFHPDLRLARFMPRFTLGPRIVKFVQGVAPRPAKHVPADVTITDVAQPSVSLRIYRPSASAGVVPALYWIHGGGYVIGSPEQDDTTNIDLVQRLGIVVVAVRYRLAPTHPAPAGLDDAYAGLAWLFENAGSLGVDSSRIAIGGASAGGGMAAAVTQRAHDRGDHAIAFQLLVYPMLDDRTATRTDMDTREVRVWEPGSNRYAWEAYLGQKPGLDVAPPYVVPARRADLRGLPRAWIGVGTLDLFHDEDVAYARRLREAGIACDLEIVPGAFHGFEVLFPNAPVSKHFLAERARVLGEAFRSGLD